MLISLLKAPEVPAGSPGAGSWESGGRCAPVYSRALTGPTGNGRGIRGNAYINQSGSRNPEVGVGCELPSTRPGRCEVSFSVVTISKGNFRRQTVAGSGPAAADSRLISFVVQARLLELGFPGVGSSPMSSVPHARPPILRPGPRRRGGSAAPRRTLPTTQSWQVVVPQISSGRTFCRIYPH